MANESGGKGWQILGDEPVADYEIFRVSRSRVRSGGDGRIHDFHVAHSPEGVTVLAWTPAGELVLVEQFRVPLAGRSLETPSGIVDAGETPVEAGRRELREETGFLADHWRLLGTLDLNPSWQTTRVHVLLASHARREADKDLDAAEETRVVLVDPAGLRRALNEGRLRSAVALAALALQRGDEDEGTIRDEPGRGDR